MPSAQEGGGRGGGRGVTEEGVYDVPGLVVSMTLAVPKGLRQGARSVTTGKNRGVRATDNFTCSLRTDVQAKREVAHFEYPLGHVLRTQKVTRRSKLEP